MRPSELSRRDFTALAAAALGGLLAGITEVGAEDEKKEDKPKDKDKGKKKPPLLEDKHVCRGLNTCKNKGKGKNECAGQGNCAVAKAHTCKGENDCRGQGGCAVKDKNTCAGENECKGKGGCEVPLSDKTWPKARKRFEELMTKAGKKFGDAPPKKS